jgi:co-chaperonin GroES (HSP10)
MMNIKPLKDRVACVRLKKTSKTESGIILTKDDSAEVDQAEVIACGPDVTMVSIGEKVLIDWNKVAVATIDGIPTYLVAEENIVGVFED